jgi:hypothetical protein
VTPATWYRLLVGKHLASAHLTVDGVGSCSVSKKWVREGDRLLADTVRFGGKVERIELGACEVGENGRPYGKICPFCLRVWRERSRPNAPLHNAIAGLTKQQRAAFDMLCIQRKPRTAESVLRRLVALGLLEETRRPIGGHPPVTVVDYDVPTMAHVAWAQLCSWEMGGEVEGDDPE